MKLLVRVIDSISEHFGSAVAWLSVCLVSVMFYEVIMRYVFSAPTFWAYQTSIMIGSSMATLGFANTLLHGGHVRVDIFYARLSAKGKAIVDGVFFLLIFLPLLIVFVVTSSKWVAYSLRMHEKLIETTWYPPSFPIRTVFLLGWFLFGLQALAQFLRDLYLLWRGKPL